MTSSGGVAANRGFRVFHGATNVFELIAALVRRPRVGDRWAPDRGAADVGGLGLPMVCLVRSSAHDDVLNEVALSVRSANPGDICQSYLDLARPATASEDPDAANRTTEQVRDLLATVCARFVNDPNSRGPRLRFPRYWLLDALMREQVRPGDHDPDRTLRAMIQKQGLSERIGNWTGRAEQAGGVPLDGAPVPSAQHLPFWWRVLLVLLRVLTAVSFRIAVTGRVPVLSGRYRWFLRQLFLAPDMSGTFVGFARRLVDGEWQQEDQEQLRLLLMHALLEDLRSAYRLRSWQVWRRRERSYPVLLLDNISETNGGFLVLSLVNDVRNQTGSFDPLLVVTAGDSVPPDASRDDGRPHHDATHAHNAYEAWQYALVADRRRRRDTAWYLPIAIRDTPAPTPSRPREDGDPPLWPRGGYRFNSHVPRVWWLSRWVRLGVPVLVVALAAGAVTVRHEQHLRAHCGQDSPYLVQVDTECIGITDGSFDIFQPPGGALDRQVTTIAAQNRVAERARLDQPARPFITIVLVAGFTSSTKTATGLGGAREAVEGVAIAQQRQFDNTSDDSPIVRVLLANAGRNMRRSHELAALLRELVAGDPSIVGVVGLDQSRRSVKDLIAEISTIGVPMVASSLSADELADDGGPLFFQVSPQNRQEAEVVAAFAEDLTSRPGAGVPPRRVRIYYSNDEDDIYSVNLSDDAHERFSARGFEVHTWAFGNPDHVPKDRSRPLDNATEAGKHQCSDAEIVFYAGRGDSDFVDFIKAAGECDSKSTYIGGDSVSSHVVDVAARSTFSAIPYYFVTFATPVEKSAGVAGAYYATMRKLFPTDLSDLELSLHGYRALAYDAATVVIKAAESLRGTPSIPVTAATVWRQITAIHTPLPATGGTRSDTNRFDSALKGVTGTIDYGGDIGRNVPANKPITILRIDGGKYDEGFRKFCGAPFSDSQPEKWCPPMG